jgi:hypothetical protein
MTSKDFYFYLKIGILSAISTTGEPQQKDRNEV